MAFQLDHNIFFNALGAQQQKQKSFFDSLAQGIQAGQNAQALDMRRRQIQSGAHLPAPIQTGTKMHELEQIFKDPARSPEERERALSLYNHIGQAGKTYGFDRGISYGMEGQQSAWPMISGEVPQANGGMFEKLMPPIGSLGDTPGFVPDDVVERLSVADLQSTGDPAMDARRQQMYAQNASAQNNGDPLRVTVSPGSYTEDALPDLERDRIGPRQIPGFFESTGGGKATEKRMETQAQKDVELLMDPQIAQGEAQARANVETATSSEIERQKVIGRGSGEAEVDANKKGRQAVNTIDILNQAREILPIASGGALGTVIAAGKGLANMSDESTQANERLRLMSGWLVANVPRMEGPQSNFDVQNYKTMAADLGNTMKPIGDRMAALEGLIALQEKYANPDGVVSDEEFYGQPAVPQQPNAPTMGVEEDGYVFLGGDPADPKNWKRAR